MNTRVFLGITLLFAPLVVFGQDASIQGQPITVPELYVGGPVAPVIKEGTVGDVWYSQKDLTFSWQLPNDVTAVAAELFDESGKEPIQSFRPPIDSFTVPADQLTEGQHYLSVQFRNQEKWGMFSEIFIKIDATPPEPFSITFKPISGVTDAVGVVFDAKDSLSGLAYYDLQIDGQSPQIVSREEGLMGTIVYLSAGEALNITVRAYDKAGNFTETSSVIFGGSPSVGSLDQQSSSLMNTDPVYFLAGILAAMMLLMFGYMIFERQRYANSIEDLKVETDEIQDRLLRVFSALREEIYDQINNINSKKRLSKGEKSAIDSLNQALVVSESLVEREIKDVKKLLD